MKRLQFLLALPTAALGVTTKPALSRAARDKAKTFGVPLVWEGKPLLRVFVGKAVGCTTEFHFENARVRVNHFYPHTSAEWQSVQIDSLETPLLSYGSADGPYDKSLVPKTMAKFLSAKSDFKEI